MKLITIRSQILDVVKAWEAQYLGKDSWWVREGPHETLEELKKLDLQTATAADIEAIIGNNSWACPQQCDECGNYFDVVVQIGKELDYENTTTNLCKDCVKDALLQFYQEDK